MLLWELVQAFVQARYQAEERFQRRLDKVTALEKDK
jgi:ribose 5-phosphate isomerase RpiB